MSFKSDKTCSIKMLIQRYIIFEVLALKHILTDRWTFNSVIQNF